MQLTSVVPDFSTVSAGFTAGDLLEGSTGFYGLFVGFVIIVLAVKFAPAIIDFLFEIVTGSQKKRKMHLEALRYSKNAMRRERKGL